MESKHILIHGINIHYLESGEGIPILMIHGFPTSSYLWRNIIPEVGKSHHAIAIDLPGYGQSDKSDAVSYSLNFYLKMLDGFLNQLRIDSVHLIVHDLGGPIGLLWSVRNMNRVKSITFLNTLIYSNFSWGVMLFMMMLKFPLTKNWLVSPAGLRWTMQFGTNQVLNNDTLNHYAQPFVSKSDRGVLVKSVTNMSIRGFKEIETGLSKFTFPVRAIYGKKDKILPKVARTMKRLKRDLPQLEITEFPDCGHFLQEDDPQEVSRLIIEFLAKA